MHLASRWRATIACLLFCATSAAHAEVIIYRCTDAAGAVTLQNGTPCPKGSRQQKKVMETPAVAAPQAASLPAPRPSSEPVVAAPAPQAPPAPQPAPAPPAAKTPPPALFECRTWNREHYLSDVADPPPRCAPLQVTGLDGANTMGGVAACQMMRDECRPVPEARLCEAWKDRVRALDSAAAFASATPTSPEEAERVRRTLADSTCTP